MFAEEESKAQQSAHVVPFWICQSSSAAWGLLEEIIAAPTHMYLGLHDHGDGEKAGLIPFSGLASRFDGGSAVIVLPAFPSSAAATTLLLLASPEPKLNTSEMTHHAGIAGTHA